MNKNLIDILIQEKIFKRVPCSSWTWTSLGSAGGPGSWKSKPCTHTDCYPSDPSLSHPLYSDNSQAALEVLKQMGKLGYRWCVYPETVEFWKEEEAGYGASEWDQDFTKLPEAICKAALQIVGVSTNEEA